MGAIETGAPAKVRNILHLTDFSRPSEAAPTSNSTVISHHSYLSRGALLFLSRTGSTNTKGVLVRCIHCLSSLRMVSSYG